MDKIIKIGSIIMGIIVALWLIISVIGAFVHKKRTGSFPKGQGYGE